MSSLTSVKMRQRPWSLSQFHSKVYKRENKKLVYTECRKSDNTDSRR